jgi:hypothetical protein
MERAIAVSCNAYFAQLGVHDVGSQALADTAAKMGITTGALPDLRRSLPFAAYGQGEVLISPFKMARVSASIAAGGRMPDDEIARLSRILSAVDAQDKKWLKGQLRYSHEPESADRIRRLVRQLNADWLLSEPDIILSRDFRNYNTHFDPKIEQRLPPSESRVRVMHNLGLRLQIVCEMVLLNAVGLLTADVTQRLKKRLELRLLIT